LAARAGRISASDLPDEARTKFGFHEFVKKEIDDGRCDWIGIFARCAKGPLADMPAQDGMSASPLKADIIGRGRDVRYVAP
jgi:hypothetical protein